jgi:hypothetical protein
MAMTRANKMCASCPFRGMPEPEKREMAKVPADWWPCHTEQGYAFECDIQCRGHWEAQRKYTPAITGKEWGLCT